MNILEDKILTQQVEEQRMMGEAINGFSELFGSTKRKYSHKGKESAIRDSINAILRFFGKEPFDYEEGMDDSFESTLNDAFSPAGMSWRKVTLKGKWWRNNSFPMIAILKDGQPLALLPSATGHLKFVKPDGKKEKVTPKNASLFEGPAVVVMDALPDKPLTKREFARIIISSINPSEWALAIVSSLIALAVSLLLPVLSQYGLSVVAVSDDTGLILPFISFLVSVAVSYVLLTMFSRIVVERITERLSIQFENSFMARLVHLPPMFYKDHGSGDLSLDVDYIASIVRLLMNGLFLGIVPLILSFVYVIQMCVYAPSLWFVGVSLIVLEGLFMLVYVLIETPRFMKSYEADGKISNLVHGAYSGISKLKTSGCEKRIYAKWAGLYANKAGLEIKKPFFSKFYPYLMGLLSIGMLLAVYAVLGSGNIDQASFLAFNSSYGLLTSSLLSVSSLSVSLVLLIPLLKTIEPVLLATSEKSERKSSIKRLSGDFRIDKLNFSYAPDEPLIIQDLSLNVKRGEYVAIVGRTGCGKSTLLRLMLGFEKANKGAVYFGGVDISTIDLQSLYRHMGIVLQGSSLMNASIYDNIVLASPLKGKNDVMEAIRKVGLEKDLADMPMGLQTMISEGSGGISGGQKQKILIARSLMNNPSILIYDEATSALDNVSQKVVSDLLGSLKATRIVVAHRLSTIMSCDRILVLEKGHIVEDGKFQELMESKGIFYDLVTRQLADGMD